MSEVINYKTYCFNVTGTVEVPVKEGLTENDAETLALRFAEEEIKEITRGNGNVTLSVDFRKNFLLRIFNQRFNMNPNYYKGKNDVKLEVFCEDLECLKKAWKALLGNEEGETYAVWDLKNNYLIVGGAFDPSDIEIIEEL